MVLNSVQGLLGSENEGDELVLGHVRFDLQTLLFSQLRERRLGLLGQLFRRQFAGQLLVVFFVLVAFVFILVRGRRRRSRLLGLCRLGLLRGGFVFGLFGSYGRTREHGAVEQIDREASAVVKIQNVVILRGDDGLAARQGVAVSGVRQRACIVESNLRFCHLLCLLQPIKWRTSCVSTPSDSRRGRDAQHLGRPKPYRVSIRRQCRCCGP